MHCPGGTGYPCGLYVLFVQGVRITMRILGIDVGKMVRESLEVAVEIRGTEVVTTTYWDDEELNTTVLDLEPLVVALKEDVLRDLETKVRSK